MVRALCLVLFLRLTHSSRVTGHDHGTLEVLEHKKTDGKLLQIDASLGDSLSAHDITQMRGSSDGCMYEGRERMGCHAECGCSWYEQCYPKFVIVKGDHSEKAVKAKSKVNVGVCDLAMPVLAIASVLLFVVLIGLVVSARMYLTKDPPPLDRALPSNASLSEPKAERVPEKSINDGNFQALHPDSPPADEADTGAEMPLQKEKERSSLKLHVIRAQDLHLRTGDTPVCGKKGLDLAECTARVPSMFVSLYGQPLLFAHMYSTLEGARQDECALKHEVGKIEGVEKDLRNTGQFVIEISDHKEVREWKAT
eukprot:s2430_g8.t1